MFDWHFVGYHFVADVCLLSIVLQVVSWFQKFAFEQAKWSSYCPKLEVWVDSILSRVHPRIIKALDIQKSALVCVESCKSPSFLVSLLLWGGTIYGSSFLLHLPSLWKKRVQLSHPFIPLDPLWYQNLKKPKWTPPSAVFAVTWISLKALQSCAFALLWEFTGRTPFSAIILYKVCYLVLSDLFNQVFFVQHDIFGAFIILIGMIGLLVVIVVTSLRRVYLAGLLLCPLLLWMAVALTLQTHILLLNTTFRSSKESNNKIN
ncbi:hypothetical protein GAYE_PCTG10G0421 [Galdieria yellowstonensis]|uniref:Uncharacterized protein n=1 Tax=Galdieria yellowstonensis TaxID=3028027 RepID=A0AAV9I730_9RHOD|nr:hypothetical protein GAYE_PCTG10G0421 [Galdieria yellowstonensis]